MVKGGTIVADEASMIGQTLARAGAANVLTKAVAPFLAVNAFAVTKASVQQGWRQSLHRDPPASLGVN